jgi:hypothetical protein
MVYHGLAVKHLGKAVLITIFQTFTDWRRGASIETRSWLHANSTFGHHHFSTISPSGLSSGLVEGFNNLNAGMIHKNCGYRDQDHLELKLRHR